jgi:hypothetical protein
LAQTVNSCAQSEHCDLYGLQVNVQEARLEYGIKIGTQLILIGEAKKMAGAEASRGRRFLLLVRASSSQ